MHARNKLLIEESLDYIKRFIGIKYLWGGNNPIEGFDCSGLALEYLRSLGIDLKDMTAQEIYNYYQLNGHISGLKKGSLLFFGKDRDNITHIAIALNGLQMIESGGGNRRTTTTLKQ